MEKIQKSNMGIQKSKLSSNNPKKSLEFEEFTRLIPNVKFEEITRIAPSVL